MDNPEKLGT